MVSYPVRGFILLTLFVSGVSQAATDDRSVAQSEGIRSDGSSSTETKLIRVAAVQARRRTVDYRLQAADALAAVERNLTELEAIVRQAAERKCDALCFPEDTLGLLDWIGMNESAASEVLPKAVSRMLERLGREAAANRMFLVVSSD